MNKSVTNPEKYGVLIIGAVGYPAYHRIEVQGSNNPKSEMEEKENAG